MLNFFKKNLFLLLILTVVLTYTLFLGATPLFDRDEGYYVSVVLNMIQQHDYLFPIYNNHLWLEKPILLYWLMNLSISLFGKSIFAFRLHSAISGILVVIFSFYFIEKTLKDRTTSITISATIAFMPLFALISRTTMIDSTVVLSTTLTLFCLFIAQQSDKNKDRKWYYLSWLFLSISFLAKGPVGIAIILPTAFFYTLIQRDFWRALTRSNILIGAIIFCLVNSWYFLMFFELGHTFWDAFFVKQIINRESHSLVGGTALFSNFSGFFFYIAIIIFTTLPFIATIVSGLLLSLKNGIKPRQSTFDKLALLSSIFCIVTILIFSTAATKLPYYILPIYPFMAILSVYFWSYLKKQQEFHLPYKKVFWTLFYFSLGTIIIVSFIAPIAVYLLWDKILLLASNNINPTEYALPHSLPLGIVVVPLLGITGIMIIFFFKRNYKNHNINGMIATSIIGGFTYTILSLAIFFISISWLQSPAINMANKLKSKITSPSTIINEVAVIKPSLHYYLNTYNINDYALLTKEAILNKESGVESYKIIKNISSLDKTVPRDIPYYIITREALGINYTSKNIFIIQKLPPYVILGNNKAKQSWNKSS